MFQITSQNNDLALENPISFLITLSPNGPFVTGDGISTSSNSTLYNSIMIRIDDDDSKSRLLCAIMKSRLTIMCCRCRCWL